ncbi:MAG: flagellar filament capping protein FliD [Granulosicoccus sp.]|nr:flagellar filament capping protein FliD [Granulosicoccus sp.]
MITSAGVGSGLDIENIITQLMSVEREPVNNLARKQQELDVKISSLGSLKSSLSNLESSTRSLGDRALFGGYEASTGDEDIATAEAALGTSIERHTIDVQGLAQAHQLATELYVDGPDSSVTQKSYSFSSGEESFDVIIDGTNNTLLGLRDAINDSEGNTSINASVLNLDGGSRLILTAANSGAENAITAPDIALNEITPATDATFTVDGFSASSPTNSFSDVIPGVTVNLKDIGTTKLETARNTDSFREYLDEFVTNYNSMISTVDELSEGDFQGDGTLRSLKSEVSRIFYEPMVVKENNYSAFDLGLTFDQNGVLSINDSVFSEVTTDDTENFITAMTDPDEGFSQRVMTALDRYTDVEGLIAAKEDSYEARKQTYDDQSGRIEYRLEQTEARLRRQFTSLDTLVSQLQATSSYLTDQLGSLTNNSNNQG